MKSSENLKISREIYMEDLEFIHNRVFEELQKRDIWFDSVTDDNKFSDDLMQFLEKAFDYPSHRNYN